MKYVVLIERAPENYAAYVPDLPGCVATGDTEDAVIQAIRKAMEWHLDGMRLDGVPIPEPQIANAMMIDVHDERHTSPSHTEGFSDFAHK